MWPAHYLSLGVVDVRDIIKSDISPLGDRRASGDTNINLRQIDETIGQRSKNKGLVEHTLRRKREAGNRDLAAVHVRASNRDSSALGKASGAASVGPKSPPEALEVELGDTIAALQGGVGVKSDGAELEKVDGTGGTDLVGTSVRDDAGNGQRVLKGFCQLQLLEDGGHMDVTYQNNNTAVGDTVVSTDGKQLRSDLTGFEVIELGTLVKGCFRGL